MYDVSQAAEMKQEINSEIDQFQTTARIDLDLHAAIKERLKGSDGTLTEAINQGLMLWLVMQDADEEYVSQISQMVKGKSKVVRAAWERKKSEKTTKQSVRRFNAG